VQRRTKLGRYVAEAAGHWASPAACTLLYVLVYERRAAVAFGIGRPGRRHIRSSCMCLSALSALICVSQTLVARKLASVRIGGSVTAIALRSTTLRDVVAFTRQFH
jgi:hypothetical protein